MEVQSEESSWATLTFTNGMSDVTFDLLKLTDVTKDLSVEPLPVGSYSKIRLHIGSATAYFADAPDEAVELKVPSDKIDIIVKFEVLEGATTQVIIDMTADWTAISNSNNLRPVLKATVVPPTEPTSSPSTPPTT